MFKQSEIGAKCGCGKGETVAKELGFKRYRLPKSHFEDGYYLGGGYYSAEWMSLYCEQCGNKREDFIAWKWHSNGDLTPIDDAFHNDQRPRRYPEIYRMIREMMPK